jgi:nitrogenase molybdenum-iron protein alpha chain
MRVLVSRCLEFESLRARVQNPFLPKPPSGVRWVKGPFAEKRSKFQPALIRHAGSQPRLLGEVGGPAGRLLTSDFGPAHWHSNLDMIALEHGPVGCGAMRQLGRLALPGFRQGIESFTALHLCTDLGHGHLPDGGNSRLARALDEVFALFPLANGVTVKADSAITLLPDANVKSVVQTKQAEFGKLTVVEPSGPASFAEEMLTLKSAALHHRGSEQTPYDVVLTILNGAPALVWIVAKLLHDIGLNPILEFGSTASDMSNVVSCRLAVGGTRAQLFHKGRGLVAPPVSFLSPPETDESLRQIAAHFGEDIQNRAESVIAENRKKTDAVIARYKPRLANKLFFNFNGFPISPESFRMLGFRLGDFNGWPSARGIPHAIRAKSGAWDYAKIHDTVIADASPDLIFCKDEGHDSYWRKRGQAALPYSPVLDRFGSGFWAYDGFALLAAALDRHINAPWRKLVKPPWPERNG